MAPPYAGAFAESFVDTGTVCGLDLQLTFIGGHDATIEAFVWDDNHGVPGNVLSVTSIGNPGYLPTWPAVGCNDLALNPTVVRGRFWIGYRADFSTQPCGFYIAADLNGQWGGFPFTYIAPGLGYPTGWQNVSVVWGPTQSLGTGAWVSPDQYGVCCRGDGTCTITSSRDCEYNWNEATTTCEPDPCSAPVRQSTWGRMKTIYR